MLWTLQKSISRGGDTSSLREPRWGFSNGGVGGFLPGGQIRRRCDTLFGVSRREVVPQNVVGFSHRQQPKIKHLAGLCLSCQKRQYLVSGKSRNVR